MLKFLGPGAVAAMLATAALMPATATAAPVPSLVAQLEATNPDNILQVRDRDGDRRRYRPGRRYHEAPRHWRRYHRRPYDWRTRGCIIVGPVWFCP